MKEILHGFDRTSLSKYQNSIMSLSRWVYASLHNESHVVKNVNVLDCKAIQQKCENTFEHSKKERTLG